MIKPNYYDDFSCIANRCSFTCCQEWDITNDDGTIITLDDHRMCPHLLENKLCSLVVEQGGECIVEDLSYIPSATAKLWWRNRVRIVSWLPRSG